VNFSSLFFLSSFLPPPLPFPLPTQRTNIFIPFPWVGGF
jgi:hypothetical protein